jgi:3-hydroxyisobutyrate dehydrogenase-like beta-hydroxyacid dehydrogenase
MPVNTSRLLRYQVGRFTKIVTNSVSETRFQISAASLTNAEKNGLKIEQLLQLLEKNLKTPLPASYKKLAERWDQRHIEVKIEKAMLLRVEDPSILKILAENPRTSRLIKETLTENTILIDPAGMELIKKVLLEAGIVSQIELDV